MVKLLYLISTVCLFKCCKIPPDPYLKSDEIQIIKKGKYIYKNIKGMSNFNSPSSVYVLQIDTFYCKNDTSFYIGKCIDSSKLNFKDFFIRPLKILKTNTFLQVITQSDYIADTNSIIGNFYLPLPFDKRIEYKNGISQYLLEYNYNTRNYNFDSKSYSDRWRITSVFEKHDNDKITKYERVIYISPLYFIQEFNSSKFEYDYLFYSNLILTKIIQ